MLRNEKQTLIDEMTQLLTDADSLFVSDYRGLSVAELSELRGKLRERGATFTVLKNTLARIAAERAGREQLQPLLIGPTAVTVVGEDAAGAAKALADYARTHQQLIVRGGLLQQTVVDAASIKALASLPSRDVLIAQVVGTMAAPMTGLVTVLQGTIGGFVRALGQVAEQKAVAGEA